MFCLMFIFTDWFLQRTNILGCLSVFVGGEEGVGWGIAAGESHRRRRASRSESHRSLTPLMMIIGEKGKRGGLSLKRHRWALLRSWLGVHVKELRRFWGHVREIRKEMGGEKNGWESFTGLSPHECSSAYLANFVALNYRVRDALLKWTNLLANRHVENESL